MAEYSEYCDTESSEKGYAIKTAVRKIGDLNAVIEDCSTKIPAYEDEVSTLGSEVAAKTKQLYEATEVRKGQKTDFEKVEKELMTSIDQLDRAVTIIKRETGAGASFIQGSSKSAQNINTAVKALGKIIDSTRISFSARKTLKSLLQTGNLGGEDNYESLRQPQAKEVAYESKSGGIISKIEEMKEKAEETLTDARNTELKAQQDYNMLEQSLNSGIAVAQDKISTAKSAIGAKTEEMGGAQSDLTETKASKAADEKSLESLKHSCTEAAANWAARQESAAAETGAINKAIEVLSEGVRVLLQKSISKKQINDNLAKDDAEFDDDAPPGVDSQSNAESQSRAKLVSKLKDLSP